MKVITSFLIFCTLFSINVAAQTTTRTVNNGAGTQAQYATIAAAIAAANAGDIILIQGSGLSYGSFTLTKRVVIIGTGYYLGANGTNTQATGSGAQLGDVTFSAGSEGSILTGFLCNNIQAGTSNVTVSRCKFSNFGLITGNVSNFTIKQCFFNSGDGRGGNVNFRNNIIEWQLRTTSGDVVNNTVNCCSQGLYAEYIFGESVNLRNNIFGSTGGTGAAVVFPSVRLNNLFVNSFPSMAGGGNLVNVNFNGLFVGFPTQGNNSLDGRYQLSTTSIAKGAGTNGVDCGAFGGDEPYVLSGIPFIPNIYELTVPNVASSGFGLRVTIKAKTNN